MRPGRRSNVGPLPRGAFHAVSARRGREDAPDEPDRLHSQLFTGTRTGGIGLLRDLQDLYLMAAECDITWTVVGQAAYGVRDKDLLAVVRECEGRPPSSSSGCVRG